MAKQVSIKASQRPGVGRKFARQARASALVPAVVYGAHVKAMPIQVSAIELETVFKQASSGNVIVDLSVEEGGKTTNRLAFIQEIQRHPLTEKVLHLDFHEVRADEKLHTRVEIFALGEPEGVRTGGGNLEQVLRRLEVECLPKDLPDRIEVDVSALQIGENIHVNQVKVPQGVTILSPGDLSVFSVQAPVKEEVVVAATETKEPELIKQKKADDAGEGEKAGDAKAGAPAKGAAPAKVAGDAKGAPKAEKK